MTTQRILSASLIFILGVAAAAAAEDTQPAACAGNQASGGTPKHVLRYKFALGDVIRTKVIHQAAVKTTIDGSSQTAQTLSISVKHWDVTEVSDEGQITFVHSVEYVDMKNDVSGRDTVHYDSREHSKPPPEFAHVAKRVGVPLTRVVMDSAGKILKREDLAPGATNPSQITMPLPDDAVSVGSSWTFPYSVNVKLRSGAFKKIQMRQRFELMKVTDGIAEISVATQVLTPVDDPEIQAQLVQRQSSGTLKFDIQRGRVVHQLVNLDRRVVGYPNAKSKMHYRTRFTEKPLRGDARAAARPRAKVIK